MQIVIVLRMYGFECLDWKMSLDVADDGKMSIKDPFNHANDIQLKKQHREVNKQQNDEVTDSPG